MSSLVESGKIQNNSGLEEEENILEFLSYAERKLLSLKSNKHINIENVRITPPYIQFVNPIEGRIYEDVINIRNIGKKSVFVRIDKPKSFAFSIKNELKRGQLLSPGLTLKRKLTYNYSRASKFLPYAEFPICVNDKIFMYSLFITRSNIKLEVIPDTLDFGTINAKLLSPTKSIIVRSTSGAAFWFSIDLHRCQDYVTVEPTRGVINPKKEVKLMVQVVFDEPGIQIRQFWIKCQNPFCVKIRANVIVAGFKFLHPIPANELLTFLDFGKTYFGSTVSKTLIVRNWSAYRTMFCTTVNCNGKEIVLQKALKESCDSHVRTFRCIPSSGRFDPFEDKTLTAKVVPEKLSHEKNRLVTRRYFTSMKIRQVNFQDIFKMKKLEYETVFKTISAEFGVSTKLTSGSFSSEESNLLNVNSKMEEQVRRIDDTKENVIIAFFFAEAYTPNVRVCPSEIDLNLHVMESITRVINIKNENPHMPIYFEYIKAAYVDVDPSNGKIKEGGNVDLLIKIRAAEPGKFRIKVLFNLLYPNLPRIDSEKMTIIGSTEVYVKFVSSYVKKMPKPTINYGITPLLTHEVGFLADEITYKTEISLPKSVVLGRKKSLGNSSDIIAFPNDMPKSLRPRRNVEKRITTIFAKIPRTYADWDDYDPTEKEKKHKEMTRAYFDIYFQKKRAKIDAIHYKSKVQNKESDHDNLDYEVTNKCHLLLLGRVKEECPKLYLAEKPHPRSEILPLTPDELYNVKIYPTNITLKHVLVGSDVIEKVYVQNSNDFDLSVCVHMTNRTFSVIGKTKRILKALSTTEIEFVFSAPSKSQHSFAIMEVIINNCHVGEVDISAEAVEPHALIDVTDVNFESIEKYKVVTIHNYAHGSVNFLWKLNSSCFQIFPETGFLPPSGILKCAIYKKPCENVCEDTEAQLNLGLATSSKTVSLNVRYTTFKVFFIDNQLKALDIPLNKKTRKKAILRNLDNCCVSFSITGEENIPGVTVTPKSGFIKSKEDRIIYIDFHFQSIIKLKCKLIASVGNLIELTLNVIAEVVYPNYTITPNTIQFLKLNCFATERVPFQIENKCICRTKFQFPLEDFPSYEVGFFDNNLPSLVPCEGIFLKPGEMKKLQLIFTPTNMNNTKFYLPIMVNDILGPSSLNIIQSRSSSYFLKKNISKFKDKTDSIISKGDFDLPTLTIKSTVSEAIFNFSKMTFNYEIYPVNLNTIFQVDKIEITNKSDSKNEFCIRTDDINKNISFEYFEGCKNYEHNENSVSANLEAGENITFNVICTPVISKNESLIAPIYVRNYDKGPSFSYLSFEFKYYPVTITPEHDIVFFPPVPPCCGIGKFTAINLSYHFDDCVLNAHSNIRSLSLTLSNRTRISDVQEKMMMHLFIKFDKNIVVNDTIDVMCSCGISEKILVKACAENSIMTNHSFMRVFSDTKEPDKPKDFVIENFQVSENLNNGVDYCEYFGYRFKICDCTWPFFPKFKKNCLYYNHMQTLEVFIEDALSSHGFIGEKFLSLPEGISAMPIKEMKEKQTNKGNPETFLYLEQLLINILGKEICSYWCSKKTIPEDPSERIIYVYEIYSGIVNYLTNLGATLPYLSPEYLLSYQDYLTFVEEINPELPNAFSCELKTTYNETQFFLRSKQCWMTLLLQMCKCFIVNHIKDFAVIPEQEETFSNKITNRSDEEIKFPTVIISESEGKIEKENEITEEEEYGEVLEEVEEEQENNFDRLEEVGRKTYNSSNSLILENKFYGKQEQILFKWLEDCYSYQINKRWKDKKNGHFLKERNLEDFNEEMKDSLILLATISLYCPYFENRVDDILFNTELIENCHHNAIILLSWLNDINAPNYVTPQLIINASTGVFMVFLTAYLFTYLPSLYPQKTLVLEASSNQTTSVLISVKNSEKETVKYHVKIYNNVLECFSCDKMEFTVPPMKMGKVTLTFTAKVSRSISGYLLLNGETKGYRLSKSMAYKLETITKFDECYSKIKISIPIYKSVDVTLPIKSPFAERAVYKIFCSIGKLQSSNELKIFSWKTKKTFPTLPPRLSSEMEEIACDDNGKGTLIFQAFCLSETVLFYTLLFTCPEVGDFCIEVRLVPSVPKIPESPLEITVNEVKILKCILAKCTCKIRGSSAKGRRESTSGTKIVYRCPKYLKLSIPCQNDKLWIGVGRLFRVVIGNLKDWKEDYGTSTFLGSSLLYNVVDSVPEKCREDIPQLYYEDVEYKIHSKTNVVTLPQKIICNGVRKLKETVEVFIHINVSSIANLHSFSFTMTSSDLMEKRYYNVVWKLPENASIYQKSISEIIENLELNESKERESKLQFYKT